MKDPDIAPFSSRLPGRRTGAAGRAFLEEVRRTHGDMWADFDAFCREHGETGLTYGELGPDFIAESPYLNLYSYPAEADYERDRPLGPTWHRLDSTVRAPDTTWELPASLAERDGALIYLSLGSLGSADVGLMQRLVDLLATTEHRVIVSKGPLADQITLHDNQVGEGFLPQPAILPQVDLVITHGGNNTVTEAFHHGKPMIVLPLFWDQVDNAQRVDETGFGRRLSTYGFRDEELTDAIDELLADRGLADRLARCRADQGLIGHGPGGRPDRAGRPDRRRREASDDAHGSPSRFADVQRLVELYSTTSSRIGRLLPDRRHAEPRLPQHSGRTALEGTRALWPSRRGRSIVGHISLPRRSYWDASSCRTAVRCRVAWLHAEAFSSVVRRRQTRSVRRILPRGASRRSPRSAVHVEGRSEPFFHRGRTSKA